MQHSSQKLWDARTGAYLGERIEIALAPEAYVGRLRRISAQWNVGDSCITPSEIALLPCAVEVEL